jgi:hypothetical protein
MTVYVQRDGTSAIIGVYANPQPGVAEEPIDDTSASVVAFFASITPVTAPTTAQQRTATQSIFQTSNHEIGRALRAVGAVVLARVNATDLSLANLFAAIAAATSLADLKSRAAAISVPPPIHARASSAGHRGRDQQHRLRLMGYPSPRQNRVSRGARLRTGLDSGMPTPPSRRPDYISTAALAELVRGHRVTGVMCDDLTKALTAIAGGVWDRYRFTADREDFVQEVFLHLMQRPLAKADVQKHVFNYFTTCAIRYGQKLRDKSCGDRRRFETYAAELVESGREIPDRE